MFEHIVTDMLDRCTAPLLSMKGEGLKGIEDIAIPLWLKEKVIGGIGKKCQILLVHLQMSLSLYKNLSSV